MTESERVRESYVESVWKDKRQSFSDDGKVKYDHLELFPNEVTRRVVRQFMRFNAKSRDNAGEIM